MRPPPADEGRAVLASSGRCRERHIENGAADADRTARMELARADADLRAQPNSAVGELWKRWQHDRGIDRGSHSARESR